MKIEKLVLGGYMENCYVVYDETSLNGFIVDPGDEGKLIENFLDKNKINLQFILLTHGHIDHVGASDFISESFNAPVYISKKDMEYIDRGEMVFGTIKEPDHYLNEGDIIDFNGKEIKVIETPGHSAGHVSFLMDNHLFSGDVLFERSIGRFDLPGGDYNTLIETIKNKIIVLPDDTIVYTGHGNITTVGREKNSNPFLR